MPVGLVTRRGGGGEEAEEVGEGVGMEGGEGGARGEMADVVKLKGRVRREGKVKEK